MFDFQFMVKIESVGNMQYSSLIIQATPVFSMLFFSACETESGLGTRLAA